jgi:hypothetical protein
VANFVLRRVDVFPSGTSVGAYKQSNWGTNIPASGAPVGSADATAVSDGVSIAFTGLVSQTDYYAVASVSGTYRYIAFSTGAQSTPQGITPVDVVGERRTLLNSAGAQTASGNSGPLDAQGVTAIAVDVNITVVSGTTPSMVLTVERLGADGIWYPIATSPAQTAAGKWSVSVGPGESAAELSDAIRLAWAITGTTPSFTFSASIVGR